MENEIKKRAREYFNKLTLDYGIQEHYMAGAIEQRKVDAERFKKVLKTWVPDLTEDNLKLIICKALKM